MFYNIVSPFYSSYDIHVLWFILGIYHMYVFFLYYQKNMGYYLTFVCFILQFYITS